VQVHPITAYNVPPAKCVAGGRMSLSDQRSRIALHTNWEAVLEEYGFLFKQIGA
jgi:hypothetical protein